ncbi:MAG: hypothetical protein VX089_04435 [Pseudomonadota bacterium]|nr:hypothetical protein [Pseudomonadota bacterium]
MKNSFVLLIISSILLFSCSTKEVAYERTKFAIYKSIPLDIYDYKVIVKDKDIVLPNYLGFNTNFLIQELTDWGNNKFKVKGVEKSLSLIIQNFSLEKKNIKKYKGLKKIFFSEEKIEYNLKLKLSLEFVDLANNTNTLNLNGNISFFIDDNYSINKKREFLLASYYELLKKIDQTLENQLKQEAFSKFRVT